MKKRKMNFNDYLTNIYRQVNGKPLDVFTIRDYLSYCKSAGKLFHRLDDGLYWIRTSEQSKAYEPAFRYESSMHYADPGSAIRSYVAYREFLDYNEKRKNMVSTIAA